MVVDFVLLVLFLIFTFGIVASGLRKQPGSSGKAGAMANHGHVIEIKTVDQWNAKLDEAAALKKVIVVDFTATWCAPCKHMAPIFSALSGKHTGLIFVQVDVDQLQEVAEAWDVQAMPTFIFIKDKKLVHKIVGANRDELEKKSAHYAASAPA